jgi:MOSC domain-containing protein YiiM
MNRWPIASLHVGLVRPLGPKAVPSGIVKHPVDRAVHLTRIGFLGDEQGDRKHHGGPDKAVHHYPFDHYAAWRAELGEQPLLGAAGAFGENLSTSGLTEAEVAIGDRFRLGGALLEVTQGRQPCYRLNLRFAIADMALRVQHSGRSGWYYRVLEEGPVAAGDMLQRVERRHPEWTIDRLRRVLYVDVLDREALSAVAALSDLPERWRRIAEQRLQTGVVEDWTARLRGT